MTNQATGIGMTYSTIDCHVGFLTVFGHYWYEIEVPTLLKIVLHYHGFTIIDGYYIDRYTRGIFKR